MARPRLYEEPRAADARDVSVNHLATNTIRELLDCLVTCGAGSPSAPTATEAVS